jgi:hypothetical protein
MTQGSDLGAKPPLRRARIWGLAFVGLLALGIGWLLMPTCEQIPDAELPVFESTMSLEQRAARGEPFEQKGDHWYICKSRLARAFFF